uniref:HintN domain-containing protein n=1 Tax=Globodera pallida TaxID=36090 RepID=A0A183BUM2_GLOPA
MTKLSIAQRDYERDLLVFALPNSHPVIGCARPNCFGWDLNGHALNTSDDSNGNSENKPFFHRVKHQPDGFMRQQLAAQAPNAIPSELSPSEWFQAQHSNCAANFTDSSACSVEDQWLGGIAPMADARKSPFQLRCCSYRALRHSADRGVAIVKAGQIVYGGEVLNGDRQYAFDYIANVERHVDAKGVFYEVSVRRMPCLPRPKLNAKFDGVLDKEVLKRLIAGAEGETEEKKYRSPVKESANVIKTTHLQAAVNNDDFSDFRRAYDAPPAYSGANAIEGPFAEGEARVPSPATIRSRQGNNRQPQYGANSYRPNVNANAYNQNGAYNNAGGGGGYQQQQQQQQQTSSNYYNNNNAYTAQNSVQKPQLSVAADYTNLAGSSNYPNLGTSNVAARNGGGFRQKIICDRNMTRAKRQACENYYPVNQQQTQQYSSGGGGGGSSDCCTTCGCACGCCCSSGGGFFCFAGDTLVQLVDGSQKRMDKLTMGDWVASANGSQLLYSMVESWIHRMPSEEAEFVRLELEDGRMLKLPGKHFIYASKCTGNGGYVPVEKAHARMVYAEEVRLGDCVFAQDESKSMALFEHRVFNIDRVQERGIYAPMTGTGDIVVHGVLASCYNIERNNVLQKSFFNNWKTLPLIDQIYGHISEEQVEVPSWLRLLVEHVMPFVVPK